VTILRNPCDVFESLYGYVGFESKLKVYLHSPTHISECLPHGMILSYDKNRIDPFLCAVPYRVARWYIFKPKIQIWVNFGGSCKGRFWSILWTSGLFYGHLVYVLNGHLVNFVSICYIFPRFGMLHLEKSGNPGADMSNCVCKYPIKLTLSQYIATLNASSTLYQHRLNGYLGLIQQVPNV
jgi:hypothetical protein